MTPSDNFVSQLIIRIVGSIVGAFFRVFFGRKLARGSEISERTSSSISGFNVVARLMMLAGIYFFLTHIANGGFQNPLTGMGFSLFVLGWFMLKLKQLFTWVFYG